MATKFKTRKTDNLTDAGSVLSVQYHWYSTYSTSFRVALFYDYG